MNKEDFEAEERRILEQRNALDRFNTATEFKDREKTLGGVDTSFYTQRLATREKTSFLLTSDESKAVLDFIISTRRKDLSDLGIDV